MHKKIKLIAVLTMCFFIMGTAFALGAPVQKDFDQQRQAQTTNAINNTGEKIETSEKLKNTENNVLDNVQNTDKDANNNKKESKKITFKPGQKAADVDGNFVLIDAAPYVEKGTTMVPLRFIAQDILGAEVNWDSDTGKVYIDDGTQELVINNKDGKVYKDGKAYIMPVAPALKGEYTFVPLRLLSELFGCEVDYNQNTKSITIITGGKTTEPDEEQDDGSSKKITFKPGQKTANVNGKSIAIDAAPYVEKGTTMVPLRFIAQDILGAEVNWISSSREVHINDGNIKVVIDLKTNKVYKDGKAYPMTVAPALKGEYTFVPLRLLSELYGCQVDYNSNTTLITIITAGEEDYDKPGVKPIAEFELPKDLVVGQKLTIVDKSYDKENLSITGHEWKYEYNGKTYNSKDINKDLEYPKEGTYKIYLRVKNSNGVWSLWTEHDLEVAKNQPPVVNSIVPSNSKPDIGEKVTFEYTYQNESWEKITEERWVVDWYNSDNKLLKRVGKPAAFFAPGPAVVSLEIKDASGQWSYTYQIPIYVQNTVNKTEKRFKFENVVPGDVYTNNAGTNFNLVDTVPDITHQRSGPTLVASNNPEKVSQNGILYSDTVEGNTRIRYHHRNTSSGDLKIMAAIENPTDKPITIEIEKFGQSGPSKDIIQVGHHIIADYLSSTNRVGEKITIKPGETIALNTGQRALAIDEVVAGLIDIKTTGKLKYTVAAMPSTGTVNSIKYLNQLPREGTHIRGTFPKANINMNVNAKGDQIQKVIVGRADAYDGYFIEGVEKTTGETIVNNGNRAVVHEIKITAEKRTGVILNPRGTIYKGVLKGFDGELCYLSHTGIMQGNIESVVIGVIEPGQTKTITYIAPSGSDSPVLLVLIPEAQWDKP